MHELSFSAEAFHSSFSLSMLGLVTVMSARWYRVCAMTSIHTLKIRSRLVFNIKSKEALTFFWLWQGSSLSWQGDCVPLPGNCDVQAIISKQADLKLNKLTQNNKVTKHKFMTIMKAFAYHTKVKLLTLSAGLDGGLIFCGWAGFILKPKQTVNR